MRFPDNRSLKTPQLQTQNTPKHDKQFSATELSLSLSLSLTLYPKEKGGTQCFQFAELTHQVTFHFQALLVLRRVQCSADQLFRYAPTTLEELGFSLALLSWRRDLKFVWRLRTSMTDPKMDDNPNPETSKVAQGAPVDNDGDMKMTDTGIEKDESPQMEESPQSKDIKVESENYPNTESGEVDKEELPHFEEGQVGDDVATVDLGDQGQHVDDSCLVEDKCLVDATVADPHVDGNTNDIHGENGITDGANLDPQNHSDSTSPNEKFLERKSKEEKGEELDNIMTGMESSPVHNGTKEEEAEHGLARTDSSPNIESKEEESNNGETVNKTKEELNEGVKGMEILPYKKVTDELLKPELDAGHEIDVKTLGRSFLLDPDGDFGDEAGTEEEQLEFMKELETFHKENFLEFKAPKFYGEPLNCLKLWRAVVRLGGYEQVTSCKLWRQVGESFKPPKTCTTVSWTFRCFYEKALLEYEKHKMRCGELPFTDVSSTEPASAGNQACLNQASGSGRARRDAAARAMQGWHSQRLLGNGEVGDPIIKDKNTASMPKREKQLKSIGLLKRKKQSPVERAVKVARMKSSKPQVETMVVDIGPPADWVKINVQRTKDCFEVYALVPGLLREEVRVQSDPVGRLVISGQPEQLDNPWGVTPFKKVVSLPSRIDPHQTSAVVTLHGQLFVRVPFEQSDL